MLWLRNLAANSFTYEVNKVAANGKPSAATDIFAGGHWGSLSNAPTLLNSHGKPLAVFDGTRGTSGSYSKGCIYGASGASQPWQLQTWSLSNDCANPIGAGTPGRKSLTITPTELKCSVSWAIMATSS